MTTTSERPTAQLSYLTPAAIKTHPRNPRHRAIPDEELITSIKEHGLVQPLVVAVVTEAGDDETGKWREGEYMLIGGHRRLAAARKARLKEVSCVIRRDLDTEAKQLEAMILENSSRVDLTPIEEAEAFAALVEMKYKQADIARVTGKSPKTVSERLKLLKLTKSTRDRVHKGQMTIEDASALVEFSDDTETTKRLEQAATTGHDFKYQLQRARTNRKAEAEVAAKVANLLAHGARDLDATPATAAEDTAMTTLWSTFSKDPDDHPASSGKGKAKKPGCLAFKVNPADSWNPTTLVYYCLDPASHNAQLDDAQKARAAEDETRELEWERKRADIAAARAHRLQTMTEAFGSVALPERLVDLVRATLPALFDRIDRYGDTVATGATYQELAGIVEADRWDGTTQKAHRARFLQHVDDIVTGEASTAASLVAVLLTIAEDAVTTTNRYDDRLKSTGAAAGAAYFDTLEQLGHEWSPIDDELRIKLGHLDAVRACRTCGCTEQAACVTDDGPCAWAETDLCTACAPTEAAS